jgi:hypothetical protein
MLVNLAAGVVAFLTFFFFPRAPVTGFWTDSTGEIVLNLQPDGVVRNYGVDTDYTYGFRPARVLTRDMPFTTSLRIKFEGPKDFNIGCYDPKTSTLELYELSKDPAVFVTTINRPTRELKRVPNPQDQAFLSKLEYMTSLEAVGDRAQLLVKTFKEQSATDLLTEDSRARFQRYVSLAQSAQLGTDIIEQIYVQHLRTNLREQLKQNPTPDTLLAAELKKSDFFMLASLQKMTVEAVHISKDGSKASVVFMIKYPAASQQPDVLENFYGVREKDGLWHFDLFQLRDRDIKSSLGGRSASSIEAAEAYLQGVADGPRRNRARF